MKRRPHPSSWLADVDEPLRSAALDLGWAPDLAQRQQEDILDEAEWALEDQMETTDH